MVTKARGYGAPHDFADTIPVGHPGNHEPEEFSRLLLHLHRTTPPCQCWRAQQGRGATVCATPAACNLADDEDADGLGAARGLLSWPTLVSAAVVVALALGALAWIAG